MKKTISIHLSGFVFNIEEDAYEILKNYLDKIRTNLSNEEGCDEIMDDIERRIAELFQDKISPNKEVIQQADLDEIMQILGHPDDFLTQEESTATQETLQPDDSAIKSLYRDRDTGKLGGVCSGLGHYFDVDPIIFRLIFIFLVLFLASGILLYIVLLIVIPEAKTTAEKLQMRGEPINLDNIKKQVKQFADSVADPDKRTKLKHSVRSGLDRGAEKTRVVMDIILRIVGIGFTIFGLLLFILLITFFFLDTGLVPFINENRIPDLYTAIEIIYPENQSSNLIFITLFLVSVIPIISLILTGVRILTKKIAKSKQIGWTLAIVWVVSASILFICSIGIPNDLKASKTIKETIPLPNNESNQLLVDVIVDDQFSNYVDPNYDDFAFELIKADEASIYFGIVGLTIVQAPDSGDFQLIEHRHSRGFNDQNAIEKAENIRYNIKLSNNAVYLPPYIEIPNSDKFRGQYVSFTIVVPKGKSIKFGDNISRMKLNNENYDPWLRSNSIETSIKRIDY